MWFVGALVLVCWIMVVWLGFTVVFPVVLPLAAVVTTLGAIGAYFRQAGAVLLPDISYGVSPVVRPVAGADRDPAYRHYLLAQVWRDWWTVLRTAVPLIARTARQAMARTTEALMKGNQAFFLFPLWLAVCGGIVVAVLPLGIVGGLIAAVYAVTVTAGLLAWLAGVGVLLGVEQAFMLARRILQACPYPGCYARIMLPVYACPGCGQRHRRLTPNLDGAIRHVCQCGTRLPTTILLGRHRLRAHCPECDRTLPTRIGRVRVEPLPFVGGPDAGKTTFMALAVDALHGSVSAAGGHALFVDEGDERTFHRLRHQLRDGQVHKTVTDLPKAVMLDVAVPRAGRGGGNRILYLFDPSGEYYTGAAKVESMSYLAHGEALLMVLDPFALPEVQDHLLASERAVLAEKGVVLSTEDPADTFNRLRNELAARADGGRQRRVAVVLTKADLLRETAAGQGAEDDVPGWLTRMGMGNFVRELTNRAAEVRYLTSGLPPESEEIARLVGWLSGLRLNGHAPAEGGARRQAAAGDARPAWDARSRPAGRPPLSYLVTRRIIFGGTIVLCTAVLLLLVVAAWRQWGPTGVPY